MNVFSKFFSGKFTKFLFFLIALIAFIVVFWFSKDSFVKNINLEQEKSETESTIYYGKESTLSESETTDKNDAVSEQDNNEKKEFISELIQTFSDTKIAQIKKPFEDYPGYWKEIPDFDVTAENAEINDEFPFESISLDKLKGNVVLLFFTTTWCPNCVKVFQDLDNLYRKLADKKISNVKIVTLFVGMDDDEAIKSYYKENKVKSLHRFKAISPVSFGIIKAVPTCFVLNKKSVPVWGFSGIANYGSLEFLNFIEDLSKEDLK